MNFNGNFIRIGRVDVNPLLEIVLRQTEADWNADASRQQAFEVHRHTKSIPLIYDRDFRHSNPTRRAKFFECQHVLEPIFAMIAGVYADEGQVIRCLLARLAPGGAIPAHVDSGYSLRHSHRVHIPVITHDKVSFVIAGEEVRMAEGEAWEINNCRPHAVANHGDAARVHLIVDWAPPMAAADPAAEAAAGRGAGARP
jgi:hypothetical protein